MSLRSTRGRPDADLWSAPVFPHPVHGFVGRRAELDRIAANIDHEVLFLVYGVGGIGKTEFVYQAMREIRSRPRWADATPILVEVRPGTTAARTLAQLLSAVGAAPTPRRGQPTEEAHMSEQLHLLARVLDARPYLLCFDDVHNLPAEQVGEALGYLARHVQRSRMLVASRQELPLALGARPPLVTNLGPLDDAAAEEMMTVLADRMQRPRPEPAAMLRATHGSPFHIHRLLVRHAPETGSLDESLDELSPAARRALLAVSVARHRPSIERLRQTWFSDASIDDAIDELRRRFLLELEHETLAVHDLVREALLGRATAAEVEAAHEDAAGLCLGALLDDERGPLLLAVDAVEHFLAAGRAAEAWDVVARWTSALAAAGSEHLLLGPLERLREALPARHVAIDLLIARSLVRASLLEQASGVLARVDPVRTDAEEARYCVLAGNVAQRAGDIERAEALFERAVACAPDADARFQARLQRASAVIFAGDGARARPMVAAALADLPAPTPRQEARAGWTVAISWMFDERFEQAAEQARRVRRGLEGTGLDDLATQLAMLEVLACVESEDMVAAREAARAIDETGPRRRAATLCRAILRYADGDAQGASVELGAAHDELRAHGDAINAFLAGHYGSAALADCGHLGQALTLATRTAQLALGLGLRGPATRSLVQQALIAADAMQCAVAHRLADEALATGHVGPRSRAKAHFAHARAYTIEGDISRALEHIAAARAAVAAPELATAQLLVELEHAAIDLIGGNLEHAVACAERVIEELRGRARDFEVARARLVLSAAYVARGRRTDLLFAERTIAQARELADQGRIRPIQVGCAILTAAMARRANRDRDARDVLAEALRALDPERASIYAGTLMAAIDGGAVARAAPGAVALLAHLGFSEAVDCYLVDQHGRRAATEQDVARERETRELLVDEVRSVIVARRGEHEIRGRPMLCSLLSVLVQARGEPVTPDTIYKQVWGGTEYHPLQHRNALYVALNRLRTSLRVAFPDREVVERASSGWRLGDEVDACVAVAVRKPSA